MTLPLLAPRLMTWYRTALDKRDRRAIAKSTIDTFLQTKGLTSAEITAILATITAD